MEIAVQFVPILLTAVILILAFIAWWFRQEKQRLRLQCASLEGELATAKQDGQHLRSRYAPIVDLDAELAAVKESLDRAKREHQEAAAAADRQRTQLGQEYERARATYDGLKREIALLEENLEDISFGLYRPHFSFQTSEDYRAKLESLRDQERQLIRDGRAATCSVQWTVGGSTKEGARMAKQNMKLVLRAFNGECDGAVANVSWNNITKMEERIRKACDAINQLGTVLHVSITQEFLRLKLDELRLTHEYEEKKYQEREEQRRIREQIRDEEKAQREIEKARQEAEEEEDRYQKSLERARAEAAAATGTQLEKLTEQIRSLEFKVNEAHSKKERAVSRAQLTKSGFVYVISNVGSFGEGVVKIGMTRRMEPMERIAELGDASVPFPFDLHAMLYSDNAPELEKALQEFVGEKSVNLVNPRKEFYYGVELDQIEGFVRNRGLSAQFIKLAEAKEYRETLSMRERARQQQQASDGRQDTEKFPQNLFGTAVGSGQAG